MSYIRLKFNGSYYNNKENKIIPETHINIQPWAQYFCEPVVIHVDFR